MKKVCLIVLTLLCSSCVIAQTQPAFRAEQDSLAEKEIQKLEFFLADLIEKGEAETYAGYLTDDYARISANGTISNKQQVLEGFNNAKSKVKMMPHDLKVRVYGTTAILQGLLDLETRNPSGVSKRTSIFTKVFIKKDANGTWLHCREHPYNESHHLLDKAAMNVT
jgi:ketosteroid isomerase-like protein